MVRNSLDGSVPQLPLSSLNSLELRGNRFDGMLPLIEGAKQLSDVDISQNMLSGLSGFVDVPKLRIVNAQDNLIATMPRLENLPALKILALDQNKISSAFPRLDGLTSLQELSLRVNKFSGV